MSPSKDDAVTRLLEHLNPSWVFGQIWICRVDAGFELRHNEDCDRAPADLKTLGLNELRSLATFREDGAFRPLRVAPDLKTGWRVAVSTEDELTRALNLIYPGALADWHAVETDGVDRHVQNYRDYTNRQTGMYRLTQKVTDEEIGQTARACCHPNFCLKRRAWTAPSAPAQDANETSAIPCLEPCAVLMEMARGSARNAQQETQALPLTSRELDIIDAALERAIVHPPTDVRVGEVARIDNPRRIQLLRERIEDLKSEAETQTPGSDRASKPQEPVPVKDESTSQKSGGPLSFFRLFFNSDRLRLF